MEREELFREILYANKFGSKKKASRLWEEIPEVKAFRKLRKEFDRFKETANAFIEPIQWETIAIGGEHGTTPLLYSVGDEWISVDSRNTMEAAMLNGVIERIEQVEAREWHVIVKNRLGETSGKNVIRGINHALSKKIIRENEQNQSS